MATINGLTKERMLDIEAMSVVDGNVVGDNLILTRHDESTIDAGNVRGPIGNGPIGTVIDYMGTVSPSASWLPVAGQTVLNAQTLYPDWWAIIPAAMKSGSSAIMPDAQGKVAVGYNASDTDFNAIGKVGGAKTVTLDASTIPLHAHSMQSHTHLVNPPATTLALSDFGHNHTQNSHNHTQDAHNHTPTPHDHGSSVHHHALLGAPGSGGYVQGQLPGGSSGLTTSPAGNYLVSVTSTDDATVIVGSSTAYVDAATATNQAATAANNAATTGITGSVDIAQFDSAGPSVANTGNIGTSGAHNNVQPYVTFMKLVKVL